MKTVLYARVSTTDQTIGHQKTQAEQAGFTIDEVISDDGVSGVSTTLRERPEGRRLYDMLRQGDTLVVRWVDRLGRNYADVTEAIREFMGRGVIIKTVINKMTFDGATADPIQMAVRDALIGFMAATAQAQHEATKASQRAGIEAARAEGRSYLGRKPSYDRRALETVINMLATGTEGTSEIARSSGLTRQTVLRIKANPAAASAQLEAWDGKQV